MSFTYWINAQDIGEGYSWEEIDNKTVHWLNCTINGTLHYDADCLGWFGQFVLWMGNL